MPELWFVIVCAFFYCLYRLARSFVERRAGVVPAAPCSPAQGEPPTAGRPPSAGELRPLSEWAFDYERMVIASGAATAAQRNRALHLVSGLIVPLIGHVRVCELDDELVRSVRRVLAAQLREHEAPYVARIWVHFVAWVRYHAAPPARRNILTFLDADVLRVYDEFTDG